MASLGDFPAAAVLRAQDLVRATKFYSDVLGLKPGELSGPASEGMAMLTASDGTMVLIYERPGMPAPQNTALGFGVPADRFDALAAELRAHGVSFEDYDLPGIKTVDGIASMSDGFKGAWFKDPDGNILSLGTLAPS